MRNRADDTSKCNVLYDITGTETNQQTATMIAAMMDQTGIRTRSPNPNPPL